MRPGTRPGPRDESNRREILAEKNVGWTDRSSVALGNDREFPPLNPTLPPPSNQNASTRQECGECTELKILIERQNGRIQEQNVQIRALMSKIDALASGSSATKVTKTIKAPEDADENRKVPRKDPPSPHQERRGESQPTQQVSNVQEAMDAETAVDRETAAAAPQTSQQQQQPPQRGELAAILAANNQINEKLGNIDASLEALEGQLKVLSVKHERLAAKVATITVKNRFAALKKERANKIKESIAYRRGRIETSEEDDEEAKQ